MSGSDWDVVVDVSNVCRDRALPPSGEKVRLSRLELLTRAWLAAKETAAEVILVADKSLALFLDEAERRAMAELRDDGRLLVVEIADEVLLDVARRRNLHVLSRDHFIDHRGEHGWIEANPHRFHCWTVEGETPSIVPRGIRRVSRQSYSRAREIKKLRLQGLDPEKHRRILTRRWRCRNTDCSSSRTWQGELLLWPVVTAAGRPLCPNCAVQLQDVGPRTHTRQVVVSDERTGAESLRFPLEVGVPLTLGRGELATGVNLAGADGVDPAAAARLSRAHLALALALDAAPGQLRCLATDLGSTNGTTLLRRAPGGFHEPVPLVPDETVAVDFHDRLVLAGVMRIEISGQRYVADTRLPDIDVAGGGSGPTTTGSP
jgi:hypothetical protein